MTIGPSAFLALVRIDFMAFPLFSAGHQASMFATVKWLQRQLRDHVLEFIRRLEYGHLPIRYRYDITGTRIARLSRLTQLDLERTKAADFDVVTIFYSFLDSVEKRVDNDGHIGPCEASLFSNFFNQVRFSHRVLPRLHRQSIVTMFLSNYLYLSTRMSFGDVDKLLGQQKILNFADKKSKN
jgi:hypothetical protein